MFKRKQESLKYTLMVLGCSALVACGSSDSDDSDAVIKGTAAEGAPIANAVVNLRCTGGAFSTQTDAEGHYSVSQTMLDDNKASLPCALEVSGSSMGTFFSYSASSGVANITPLTTLAVGRAASMSPATWFAGVGSDYNFTSLDTAMESAVSDLKAQLSSSTSGGNPDFDIFGTSFKADGQSPYDQWLDAFQQALGSTTFSDFLTQYQEGNNPFTLISITLPTETDTSTPEDPDTSTPVTPDNPVTPVNPGDAIPSGDYTLHLTVKVMGTSTVTTIENMPKPANQSEFCAGDYESYMGSAGALQVNSCSFSGNKGTIKATVNAGISLSYEAVYEWK